MPDQTTIAEIRAALRARPDAGRTHWTGCEVDPRHRDCAIARLLGALDDQRTQLRALITQWRENWEHHEVRQTYAFMLTPKDCADQLAALLGED